MEIALVLSVITNMLLGAAVLASLPYMWYRMRMQDQDIYRLRLGNKKLDEVVCAMNEAYGTPANSNGVARSRMPEL